jgi:hypothetical protein
LKPILALLLIVVAYTAHAQNTKQVVTIAAIQNYSMCTGVVSDPQKPQPIVNRTFYLKKGTINNLIDKIIDTLTSNNNGIIKLKLKNGNYYLIDAERLNAFVLKPNDTYHTFDSLCLHNNWKTPNLAFKLSSKTTRKNYVINYYESCDHGLPCCSKFTGSLPQ